MRATRVSLVSLASLATLALTAAPAQGAARIYAGETSHHDAIVISTDARGARVTRLVLGWTAVCASGRRWSFHRVVPLGGERGTGTPALGRLLTTRNTGGNLRGQVFGAAVEGSGSSTVTIDVRLEVRGGRATGFINGDARIYDRPGVRAGAAPPEGARMTDRCRSGQITVTADHRPGRIFGGATSQGEPLLLRVDAGRTRIREALVGWHASCSAGDMLDVPDDLFDLALGREGRFARVLTWPPPGSGDVVTYDIAGRVGRRSASGTLGVRVAAQTGASCATGALRWSAASS